MNGEIAAGTSLAGVKQLVGGLGKDRMPPTEGYDLLVAALIVCCREAGSAFSGEMMRE